MHRTVYSVRTNEPGKRSVRLFSSQALALQFRFLQSDFETCSVEEWNLDAGIAELRNGLRSYTIIIRRDGTRELTFVGRGFYSKERRTHVMHYRSEGNGGVALNHTTFAKNEQDAISEAERERMNWLLTGRWDHGTDLELMETDSELVVPKPIRMSQRYARRVFTLWSGFSPDLSLDGCFSTSDLLEEFRLGVPDPDCRGMEMHEADGGTCPIPENRISVLAVMLKDGSVERTLLLTGARSLKPITSTFFRGTSFEPAGMISIVFAPSTTAGLEMIDQQRRNMLSTGNW